MHASGFFRFGIVLVALGLCAIPWVPVWGMEPPRLTPLAIAPDWSWLDAYQGKLRRSELLRALDEHYAPGGTAAGWIEVGPRAVRVKAGGNTWKEIALAPEGTATDRGHARRFWRKAREMGPAPAGRPLQGVRIAIDPGHLGGSWARMEERYFQMPTGQPVMEGDLTLQVAKKLQPQLEKLGAQVTLLRKSDLPTTRERPETLKPAAEADLNGSPTQERIRLHSELFFYRISEIRARARLVNEQIQPDVVVCLHLNAEDWGEPESPQLVPRNHFHTLVNGCYGPKELGFDDVRAEMLEHLFAGTADESVPLSETVAEAVAEESGLPPFTYFSSNARRVGKGPYVYARNLLATRLYRAPVVYLEPYVMNSGPIWRRVQAGDYTGTRSVQGVPTKSLVSEYAAGVAAGLARYYADNR
ncbi:MAG: hypothetical protein RLZZ399_1047 [Verrucomicrobiota bacterium]